MVEKINPATEEKIRELCRKISVAHNLDNEIRDELYGHIEDKLLGYLNGDEKLTEDDALILVREHFGSPAVIKSLLQDVHPAEVHMSFARNLGAIFVASWLIVGIIGGWINVLTFSDSIMEPFINFAWNLYPSKALMIFLASFIQFIVCIPPVFVLWYILLNWRKKIENNQKPWFLTVNFWTFLSIIILIAAILPLIIILAFHTGHQKYPYDANFYLTDIDNKAVIIAGQIKFYIYYLQTFLVCLAWLWWFDTPPRRKRTIGYAFLSWFVYKAYITGIIGGICVTFHNSPSETPQYVIGVVKNILNLPQFITNCIIEWESYIMNIIPGLLAVMLYLSWKKLVSIGIVKNKIFPGY